MILFGEDVAAAGGVFKSTVGLFERFSARSACGTRRSPSRRSSARAIGAAIMGLRPIAEIMFADFAGVCLRPARQPARQVSLPDGGPGSPAGDSEDGERCRSGVRRQHSQAAENWFLNVPGLKIAVPGTVEDCYGLLAGRGPR